MEMIEKVERLREKANVTYEEAKAALEQTGGDLLDAMVLLERQGKVKGPAQSTYSTDYEEQQEYVRVKDKVEEQEQSAPSFGRTIGRLCRGFVRFLKKTTFIVTSGEDTIFTMPTIVFAILLFFLWEVLAPVMVIALFFGIRYSFEGEEEAKKANSILNKAGDFAQDVKSEFTGGSDPQENKKSADEEIK
ncbi:MAG: hypothetical protein IJ198_10400 [Lachnospiraceae bacterium]|nr:hypothetical protein [Lachnospiraceae bacterium]